jgi:hypothetical protein
MPSVAGNRRRMAAWSTNASGDFHDDDETLERLWLEARGRRVGCIPCPPPPDDGRYQQLSMAGGSFDNYDTPHVTSTEPAAA